MENVVSEDAGAGRGARRVPDVSPHPQPLPRRNGRGESAGGITLQPPSPVSTGEGLGGRAERHGGPFPGRITRRKAVAGLAATTAALALPRAARAAARRPNIVFVLIDDLDYRGLSCTGHPYLRTPNCDRIGREGAIFGNAFVCCSLCSPSRANFLTGCLPQRTGVLTNRGEELDRRVPTFPALLHDAGYETAYVGKWHQGPTAEPRPGFDEWFSFVGQGVYEDPELNENGRAFRATGYLTDLLNDAALRFLRRPRAKPFCLYLAHKAVHGPATPAPRHRNACAAGSWPEPPSYTDDLHDKPAWERAAAAGRKPRRRGEPEAPVPDRLGPPPPWNPARDRDRSECMLSVDEGVGQLLAELERQGVLDDTIVVFTSDNGYFLGEHRRGDKRLAYEESLRIPLLLRYPRLVRAGSRIDPMVLNLDLAPTLLDLCGVALPPVVHGCSARALLADPAARPAGWRTDWLYQYFEERQYGIPDLQAIRTERWKLIRSPQYPAERELYDLQADPIELHNLAGRPEHAELQRELEARLDRYVAEAEASRLPAPPGPPPLPPATLLHYTFATPGAKAVDSFGNHRDAVLRGVPVREVDGRSAAVFDGKAAVTLTKEQSPPIQGGPFTVTVTLRPEQPDGVVASQGGQSQGYSLELEAGRPVFAVRAGGDLTVVDGEPVTLGRWQTWTASLLPDGRLGLAVDGRATVSKDKSQPLRSLPNNGFALGDDPDSRVREGQAVRFVGAIAEVEVSRGGPAAGED